MDATAPVHPAATPKRARGLAITSLVLGIVGLVPVLGLATGVIGLALGITALVKRTTSKGLAIAGTALGCVASIMIPLHIGILTMSVSAARFAAGSAVCASNMKQIGAGIAAYQQRHGGSSPPSLNNLVADGLVPATTLQCPLHAGDPSANGYEYDRPAGATDGGMLVWDRYEHRVLGKVSAGRNVLAADMSLRFLTEQQFRSAPRAATQKPVIVSGRESSRGLVTSTAVPEAARPPPAPAMTVSTAITRLKSPAKKDLRDPLLLLATTTVDPKRRDEVIGVIKPLLNDVDYAGMAFDAFANWAGEEQVPDLIDLIRTAPASERGRESMKILARLGDARAAEPLADCLKEFAAIRDAKAALAALGDVAKPAVLPFYHHPKRPTREAARELLRGYHAAEAEILAVSIKSLGGESPDTRMSAIAYFSTETVPDDQREAVAIALRPLLADDTSWVRDSARKAMKKMATKADTDFLLEQLKSTDNATRELATELLVEFKEPRLAGALAVLLSDRTESFRAANTLVRIGTSAEPAVLSCLRSSDPDTRKRAAEVLGKIGTAQSLAALQVAAKDTNFFARSAASYALKNVRARTTEAQQRP